MFKKIVASLISICIVGQSIEPLFGQSGYVDSARNNPHIEYSGTGVTYDYVGDNKFKISEVPITAIVPYIPGGDSNRLNFNNYLLGVNNNFTNINIYKGDYASQPKNIIPQNIFSIKMGVPVAYGNLPSTYDTPAFNIGSSVFTQSQYGQVTAVHPNVPTPYTSATGAPITGDYRVTLGPQAVGYQNSVGETLIFNAKKINDLYQKADYFLQIPSISYEPASNTDIKNSLTGVIDNKLWTSGSHLNTTSGNFFKDLNNPFFSDLSNPNDPSKAAQI